MLRTPARHGPASSPPSLPCVVGRARRENHPLFFLSSARARRAALTSGAREGRGSAVWMKGCWRGGQQGEQGKEMEMDAGLTFNKSCALARFSGSTLRAKAKKSRKTGVRFCSSLISGVPLVAMR